MTVPGFEGPYAARHMGLSAYGLEPYADMSLVEL